MCQWCFRRLTVLLRTVKNNDMGNQKAPIHHNSLFIFISYLRQSSHKWPSGRIFKKSLITLYTTLNSFLTSNYSYNNHIKTMTAIIHYQFAHTQNPLLFIYLRPRGGQSSPLVTVKYRTYK